MLVVVMEEPHAPSSGGDPLVELRNRLQRLRRVAGEPSTREISNRTGKAISHTTVHVVLRCSKVPRWGQLELVVEALEGNKAEFHPLWVRARDAVDRLEAAMPESTLEQGQAAKTTGIADIRADDNDLHHHTDHPIQEAEVARSSTQTMASEGSKERSTSPASNSMQTVAAIEIITFDAIKQLFAQSVVLSNLNRLYGAVAGIVAGADPGAVVNFFANMMILVFDIDKTTEAVNAVIRIQETAMAPGFHCSIGVSSGEVMKFAAHNTNVHYFGTAVDCASGLCRAASAKAIFIDQATMNVSGIGPVRSQLGVALRRSPSDYKGNPEWILLKGFNEPIQYCEIFWDQQLYGVKSAVVTQNRA